MSKWEIKLDWSGSWMKYSILTLRKELDELKRLERTTLARLENIRDDEEYDKTVDELSDINIKKNEIIEAITIVEDMEYGIEEWDEW